MTVSDLIESLKKYDPNAYVEVHDPDKGILDVESVEAHGFDDSVQLHLK